MSRRTIKPEYSNENARKKKGAASKASVDSASPAEVPVAVVEGSEVEPEWRKCASPTEEERATFAELCAYEEGFRVKLLYVEEGNAEERSWCVVERAVLV